MLHGIELPKIFDPMKEALMGISDWYFEKTFSYIVLYGFDGTPHHFPKYVDDHLMMFKIC